MIASGLLAVILAWPAPDAQAVRLAQDIGAQTVIIHDPSAPAPSHAAPLQVLAQIPAEAKAVEAARASGYDGAAVVAGGEQKAFRAFLDAHKSFIRYVYLKPDQLAWDVTPSQAILQHGQWPGFKQATPGEAGATERPWLVANLHLYAYLRALHPDRAAILAYPPDNQQARYESAEGALAEAYAGGGTLVLDLPEMYRTGLAKGDARAAQSWKNLCDLARFLAAQSAVKRAGGGSSLAIIAAALDEESEEFLNLSFRNNLSPEVLISGRIATAGRGLRLIAAPNMQPSAADARALIAFAQAGGTVVTSPPVGEELKPWWGVARRLRSEEAYDVHPVGRGFVHAYKEGFVDPSDLAAELRETAGVSNPTGRGLNGLDYRLWNASTTLGTLHRGPEGRTLILVSYGRRLDQDFLVGVRGRISSVTGIMPAKPPSTPRLMDWNWRVEWNQEGLNRVGIFHLKELGQ